MCIIVAKPAGVDVPGTETLNNCFTSNKDGIGISFNKTGENPVIHKGFMNIKKLESVLKLHNITKDHNLLIHFRFATHGKKDQGNCHPYPLSPSFDDMRMLHCTCGCAIAHNGVFSGMPVNQKHSDTMKFIGGILAAPEIIENLDSKAVKELIKGYCGFSSKLAFLRPAGLSLVGEFEKSDGVYYSNKQYESWGYKGGRNHDDWGEYCGLHKKYDTCVEEMKKIGKNWCYRHGEFDNCSWCREHSKWDDCEYLACCELDTDKDGNKLLKLKDTRPACEMCGKQDNVKYNVDNQINMCDACVALYTHSY